MLDPALAVYYPTPCLRERVRKPLKMGHLTFRSDKKSHFGAFPPVSSNHVIRIDLGDSTALEAEGTK
jgi:hypothetical protein